MADEVQTFKALITIHKVLQEGHPIVLKEAQSNVNWLESLSRGVSGGDGLRGAPKEYHAEYIRGLITTGYGGLISEYVFYLIAKLQFHRNHPEFNGKPQQKLKYDGSV